MSAVQTGDLVFSKIDVRNGAIGLLPAALAPAVVTSEYPVYTPDPEQVEVAFLALLLRTPPFLALLRDAASGTSGRKRVSPADFEAIEVPLPDLPEQRRLVAAYAADRAAAEALDAQAAAAERAAVDAFEAALGLVPPPDLPKRRAFVARWREFERWSVSGVLHAQRLHGMSREGSVGNWVTVGDYADVIHGCSAGPSDVETPLRVLKISAVTRGYLRPDEHKFIADRPEYRRLYDLRAGDVLMWCTNGTLAYVGAPAFVAQDVPNYIFPDKVMRARIHNPDLLPEYLWQLLQLPTIRAQIEAAARTAVGNFAIGGTDVENLEIPLPPAELQLSLMDDLRLAAVGANDQRQQATAARHTAAVAFAKAIFG